MRRRQKYKFKIISRHLSVNTSGHIYRKGLNEVMLRTSNRPRRQSQRHSLGASWELLGTQERVKARETRTRREDTAHWLCQLLVGTRLEDLWRLKWKCHRFLAELHDSDIWKIIKIVEQKQLTWKPSPYRVRRIQSNGDEYLNPRRGKQRQLWRPYRNQLQLPFACIVEDSGRGKHH